MTYDNPSRQRLGGFPMYYWQGRPVGPLGGFHVSPNLPDQIRITFDLMIRPGVSGQFHCDIPLVETKDLWYFYRRYIIDPEALFLSLGWTYSAPQTAKSLSLSLGDLGL